MVNRKSPISNSGTETRSSRSGAREIFFFNFFPFRSVHPTDEPFSTRSRSHPQTHTPTFNINILYIYIYIYIYTLHRATHSHRYAHAHDAPLPPFPLASRSLSSSPSCFSPLAKNRSATGLDSSSPRRTTQNLHPFLDKRKRGAGWQASSCRHLNTFNRSPINAIT